MPKPNMGKTQTIKERSVYVYLPSHSMVKDWKTRAAKAGLSISKFIIDRVQDSISKEEGEDGYLSRIELIKKFEESREELKKLRADNKLFKTLVDNLDNELKRYRSKPFTDKKFEGMRAFDKDLIELLRRGNSYNDEEILSRLGIEPSNTDLVRGISKQLEALEAYDLVEYSGRGWRWKG